MKQTGIDDMSSGSGSLRSYGTGFILSIILTTVAFGMVMGGLPPQGLVLTGIIGAGIAQILVHLHYFLHLNTSSSARWNILALLLTLLIMVLFIGGTLWIMYHLNQRLV
jgi:cytochrome o ubiquinol oxidase operon protein cyoD